MNTTDTELAEALAVASTTLKTATTSSAKGKALEQITCVAFQAIPGIVIQDTRISDGEGSQELDIVLWNDRDPNGLWFLHEIIAIECKNWEKPLGSQEVAWFDHKLRDAGLPMGFLLVANGLTGSLSERTAAHAVILSAQRDGRRLVTIGVNELVTIPSTAALGALIKQKLCELVTKRSLFR